MIRFIISTNKKVSTLTHEHKAMRNYYFVAVMT